MEKRFIFFSIFMGLSFGLRMFSVPVILDWHASLNNCANQGTESGCLAGPKQDCVWLNQTCFFKDYQTLNCSLYDNTSDTCVALKDCEYRWTTKRCLHRAGWASIEQGAFAAASVGGGSFGFAAEKLWGDAPEGMLFTGFIGLLAAALFTGAVETDNFALWILAQIIASLVSFYGSAVLPDILRKSGRLTQKQNGKLLRVMGLNIGICAFLIALMFFAVTPRGFFSQDPKFNRKLNLFNIGGYIIGIGHILIAISMWYPNSCWFFCGDDDEPPEEGYVIVSATVSESGANSLRSEEEEKQHEQDSNIIHNNNNNNEEETSPQVADNNITATKRPSSLLDNYRTVSGNSAISGSNSLSPNLSGSYPYSRRRSSNIDINYTPHLAVGFQPETPQQVLLQEENSEQETEEEDQDEEVTNESGEKEKEQKQQQKQKEKEKQQYVKKMSGSVQVPSFEARSSADDYDTSCTTLTPLSPTTSNKQVDETSSLLPSSHEHKHDKDDETTSTTTIIEKSLSCSSSRLFVYLSSCMSPLCQQMTGLSALASFLPQIFKEVSSDPLKDQLYFACALVPGALAAFFVWTRFATATNVFIFSSIFCCIASFIIGIALYPNLVPDEHSGNLAAFGVIFFSFSFGSGGSSLFITSLAEIFTQSNETKDELAFGISFATSFAAIVQTALRFGFPPFVAAVSSDVRTGRSIAFFSFCGLGFVSIVLFVLFLWLSKKKMKKKKMKKKKKSSSLLINK